MPSARLVAVLAALACAGSEPPAEAPARADTAAAPAEEEAAARTEMLDPNTATAAELRSLPGVRDSVALALIAGRPYPTVVTLNRVLARHLSAERRDSVFARMWILVDLNIASSEEILLIPGVDARLRQQLEEHRPYEDIGELRREVGAAISPEALARLERYVVVP